MRGVDCLEVAPTHETLRWLRWDGKDALRAFLGPAYGHARDLRFVTNAVIAEGYTVFYQATEFATLNEPLHGLPAEARTRQEQVHVFEFRGGLIVSWRMFPGVHLLDDEPAGGIVRSGWSALKGAKDDTGREHRNRQEVV